MLFTMRPSTPIGMLSYVCMQSVITAAVTAAAIRVLAGTFSGRIIPLHIFKSAVIGAISGCIGSFSSIALQQNKSMSFEAKIINISALNFFFTAIQIYAFRHLGIIETKGTIVIATIGAIGSLYTLTGLINSNLRAAQKSIFMGKIS